MSNYPGRKSIADTKFLPAGVGLQTSWHCMGCQKPRPNLGSKGAGVRKRCASCCAAKRVAQGLTA